MAMDNVSPHPDGLYEDESMGPEQYAEFTLPDMGHNDGSVDVLSSDGAFLDAQSSVSNMDAGFVPIRVRISDDQDDEDYEFDGEDYEVNIGSSENFDSASERMAALSTASSVSPSGSFKEFFALSEAPGITLSGALRQLNELNSGISSLDTSLLENTTEEEFRFRVMEIAVSNRLPLDDEVVHDILNALLPIVQENLKRNNAVKEASWDAADSTRDMPIAKPTADDEDESNGLDDVDVEGSEETSELDQSENGEFLSHSAQGLPVRVADDDSEEHEVSNLLPLLEMPMSSDMAKREVSNVAVGNFADADTAEDANKDAEAEADANEEPSLCVRQDEQTPVNQAKSLNESKQVANTLDTSVTQQETLTDISQKCKGRFEGEDEDDVQSRGFDIEDLDVDGQRLYGADHGVAKDESDIVLLKDMETMETCPEDHVFNGRKNSGVTDVEANKVDDKEEEEVKRVLILKSSTARATGMPRFGNAGPSLPARPPGLDHALRAIPHSNGASAPTSSMASKNSGRDLTEGMDDVGKKLQMIRVKFLRLAHKLGQSAVSAVVAQVLYRLELADQLRGERRSGDFSLESLKLVAEEQEAAGQGDLDFECTILVLGKSGVGKSATINSLFDEAKSGIDAYKPATNRVKEIVGTVNGIKLRVIDTPGLLTSFSDQRYNFRNMSSVKRHIKKSLPDIVLYFDRLDMNCRDYGDLPLLRTISDALGDAIWYNAIVVLTHGSAAPPDGANGAPVSYEMFVAQRSHVIQQTIRQAVRDMRLMNPVTLVENHAACRVNRAGQSVLPNGQAWKPQLLLLCFASKILAEANAFIKLQDSSPENSFRVRPRVPPLPFLLSSMLQSRAQLKLPNEQVDDDEDVSDTDEEVDSDDEEQYDDLPPFRRLTRDELTLLDKEQKRLYFEELDYREKLFMKKQLKDERARRKELKRRLAALPKEVSDFIEEQLEEGAPAAVPDVMADMALPPSFDSDNPTHRYRFLDTANQWLVRPVLDSHGWDRDCGYDGLNVEKIFVISKKVPVSVSGQITKDKKEANVQMECAASFKNGDSNITQAGLDIQTLGKEVSYTLRSETKFSNFKRNKTTCGLAVTMLGDTFSAGMKLEDRLVVGKRFKLAMSGGALTGQRDVVYGGNLEASLRDKDYPIGGPTLSTLGLSIMNWHGDLAIGGNLQLQFLVGQTMIVGRANLNNKKTGQISIRTSSSDQWQMALLGLIPLLRALINRRILGSCQSMQ